MLPSTTPSEEQARPSHQALEQPHFLPVQVEELCGQAVERGLVVVHLLLWTVRQSCVSFLT